MAKRPVFKCQESALNSCVCVDGKIFLGFGGNGDCSILAYCFDPFPSVDSVVVSMAVI